MKNKNSLYIVFFALLFTACSSVKYPSVEESETKIRQFSAQNYALDSSIKSQYLQEPLNRDVQVKISKNMLNSLLQRLAASNNTDISFLFQYTPKIYNEEKSALGIKYTNYIDLKGGKLDVNLKSLKILEFFAGKFSAQLELDGKGNLDVNGQYMGVPASAKPDVQVYLNDKVTFNVQAKDNGSLLIKPANQKLTLKIKISVKLLGWSVPYYKEIPLELAQLVKPIEVPLNFQMDFLLPQPSSVPGDNTFVQTKNRLEFLNSSVNADKTYIEYKTDINFLPNTSK